MVSCIKLASQAKKFDDWREERNGFGLLPTFWDVQETVRNLDIKPGDVWINTYPKSGTTWMQELVWLLTHNLDYEKAKTLLKYRSPTLESCWSHQFFEQPIVTFEDFERNASLSGGRRIIKSHLYWHLLPKKLRDGNSSAKIIYVARNPKDVCVSLFYFYNFYVEFKKFGLSLDDFCEYLFTDRISFGPYWPHVLTMWEHRDDPNVLFVKYEDMKKNLARVVQKVATFLEIAPLTEAQTQKLLDHLSFDSMRKNPALNRESGEGSMNNPETEDDGRFMRKGVVGNWKQKLSPEVVKKFDEWINENTKDTGLKFEYST